MEDHTTQVQKPWYKSRTVITALVFYTMFVVKKNTDFPLPPDVEIMIETAIVGAMATLVVFFRRIAGRGVKVMEWLFGRFKLRKAQITDLFDGED